MGKIIIILYLEQWCFIQGHTLIIRRSGKQVQEQNICLAKCIYKHKSLEIKLKEHTICMNIWDIFTEAFKVYWSMWRAN